MPPSSPRAPTPPPELRPEDLVPSYPALEAFVERASQEDVRALFTSLRERLGGLKGPKAEAGRKAQVALGRAEELLALLLETRERMAAEGKGRGAKASK